MEKIVGRPQLQELGESLRSRSLVNLTHLKENIKIYVLNRIKSIELSKYPFYNRFAYRRNKHV